MLQLAFRDLLSDDLHVEAEAVHRLVHDSPCLIHQLEEASVYFPLLLSACHAVVDHDFDGVLEDHLHESLSHGRRVVHGWRAIHLDEPAVKVLIDHDVISKHLEGYTLLRLMQVLDRLKRSDYAVLDAGVKFILPDVVAVGVQQVALELLEVPHVPLDVVRCFYLLAVLGDAVIGQVGVPV